MLVRLWSYRFPERFLHNIDELAYFAFEPLGDCLKLSGIVLLARTIILVGSEFCQYALWFSYGSSVHDFILP